MNPCWRKALFAAIPCFAAAVCSISPVSAANTAIGVHPTPAQVADLQGALDALPPAPGAGLLSAAPNVPPLPPSNAIQQNRAVTVDPQYLAAMVAGDDVR